MITWPQVLVFLFCSNTLECDQNLKIRRDEINNQMDALEHDLVITRYQKIWEKSKSELSSKMDAVLMDIGAASH